MTDGTPDLEARTLAYMRQDTLDPTETQASRLDFDYVELQDMIDGLLQSLTMAVEHMPPSEARAAIVQQIDQFQLDGFIADEWRDEGKTE